MRVLRYGVEWAVLVVGSWLVGTALLAAAQAALAFAWFLLVLVVPFFWAAASVMAYRDRREARMVAGDALRRYVKDAAAGTMAGVDEGEAA